MRNRRQFRFPVSAAAAAAEDFAPSLTPADLPLIGKRVQHSHQIIRMLWETASAVAAWLFLVAHTRYELKIAKFVQQTPYR
jgi:hypothetical protein